MHGLRTIPVSAFFEQDCLDFPGASDGKVSDLGLISVLGRSPGEGNGNPLQYSCLENPMGGGAWEATVHGVAKSQTRLSDFSGIVQGSSKRKSP